MKVLYEKPTFIQIVIFVLSLASLLLSTYMYSQTIVGGSRGNTTYTIDNANDAISITQDALNRLQVDSLWLHATSTMGKRVNGNNFQVLGYEVKGLWTDRINEERFNGTNWGLSYSDTEPSQSTMDGNEIVLLKMIDSTQNSSVKTIQIGGKVWMDSPIVLTGYDSISFVGITEDAGFYSAYEFPADYATVPYEEGMFRFDDCHNIVFEKLTFFGDADQWGLSSLQAIRIRADQKRCTNFTFRNNYFNDTAGIYATSPTFDTTSVVGLEVTNNRFLNLSQRQCVAIHRKGDDILVAGNYAEMRDNGWHFWQGPGGQNVRIVNNYVVDSYDSAIYLTRGPAVIDGNIVLRSGKDGIKAQHQDTSGDWLQVSTATVISNNVVMVFGKNISGVGINVQGDLDTDSTGARHFIVSDNIVSVAEPHGTLPTWLSTPMKAQTISAIISGNILDGYNDKSPTNLSGNLLRLSAGAYEMLIEGNYFVGGEKGVELRFPTNSIVVSNNYFRNLTRAALHGDLTQPAGSFNHIVFNSNTLQDVQRGVEFAEVDTLIVTNNNTMTRFVSGREFVEVSGTAELLIEHNNVELNMPIPMSIIHPDTLMVGTSGSKIIQIRRVSDTVLEIITPENTYHIPMSVAP